MCKIVFSITFNVSFRYSKELSHLEDSFEHQKCLSEHIIVDLRIISKLNIKKRARVDPPAKCHLNGIFVGGPMWVRHSVLAGYNFHDLQNKKIDRCFTSVLSFLYSWI